MGVPGSFRRSRGSRSGAAPLDEDQVQGHVEVEPLAPLLLRSISSADLSTNLDSEGASYEGRPSWSIEPQSLDSNHPKNRPLPLQVAAGSSSGTIHHRRSPGGQAGCVLEPGMDRAPTFVERTSDDGHGPWSGAAGPSTR